MTSDVSRAAADPRMFRNQGEENVRPGNGTFEPCSASWCAAWTSGDLWYCIFLIDMRSRRHEGNVPWTSEAKERAQLRSSSERPATGPITGRHTTWCPPVRTQPARWISFKSARRAKTLFPSDTRRRRLLQGRRLKLAGSRKYFCCLNIISRTISRRTAPSFEYGLACIGVTSG